MTKFCSAASLATTRSEIDDQGDARALGILGLLALGRRREHPIGDLRIVSDPTPAVKRVCDATLDEVDVEERHLRARIHRLGQSVITLANPDGDLLGPVDMRQPRRETCGQPSSPL